MDQEEELCDGRSARGRLNRKDGTDLWAEILQRDELDLFGKHEVD